VLPLINRIEGKDVAVMDYRRFGQCRITDLIGTICAWEFYWREKRIATMQARHNGLGYVIEVEELVAV